MSFERPLLGTEHEHGFGPSLLAADAEDAERERAGRQQDAARSRLEAADCRPPADLVMRGVAKSFGSGAVLRGIDLTVPGGAITALLGPSGSGKTTLLRIVAGFETLDAGEVLIGDRLVASAGVHARPEQRRVGYVPQEGALFPHLDVARNVGFGLPRERRGEVAGLLAMARLEGLGRRYPHQLSGGQQQRVALARALAVRPDVLLLDEPFSSLDPHLREEVREEVKAILRQAGITALIVTHDQDEALSFADLVAVVREGSIAQAATPRELYARPADAALASFLGEANLVAATVVDGKVVTALGELAPRGDATEGAARVLLRPEQIRLVEPSAPGLDGTVVRVSYHGHDAIIEVATGGSGERIVLRSLGDPGVAVGDPVRLAASGSALVFPPRR